MTWKYTVVGLFVTIFAAVVVAIVERAIPNYDDADEMPGWIFCLAAGAALSFAAGWVFQ